MKTLRLFVLVLFVVPLTAWAQADLVIQNVKVEGPQLPNSELREQQLFVSEGYAVRASVRNQGTGGASGVRVTISIPTGATYRVALMNGFTCTQVGSALQCDGSSLPAGTSVDLTAAFNAPPTAGPATINVYADPTNLITEPNEKNNLVAHATQVVARPDLAMTPDPPSQPQAPNVIYNVMFNLRNVGTVSVRYEEVVVTLKGNGTPFTITGTGSYAAPYTSAPTTETTVKFYPGLLDPGQSRPINVAVKSSAPHTLRAEGNVKSYDSQGKDYEKKTTDNTAIYDVTVR